MLFNKLLWVLFVPAIRWLLGLMVAVLADRLGTRGEKSKTLIFLPMAISMVGAATIWRLDLQFGPPATRRSGC